MARVHFLANVQDPTNPETVYGKGHYMDVADEAWAAQLNNEGKIEFVPAPEPQVRPPAPEGEPR